MSRGIWWRKCRGVIIEEAKARAQEYADVKPWGTRLLCWLSPKYRARWEKRKATRYTYALKFYRNRFSHTVYRRPVEEIRAENKMRRMAERKRLAEIKAGERRPIRFDLKPKEAKA
jgi:hypothetical protein